jgi:hypothetical protein
MGSTGSNYPQFLTVSQAAKRLGQSPKVLRAARDRGEIDVYQTGSRWQWVSWAEVVAWVESKRVISSHRASAPADQIAPPEKSSSRTEEADT